MDKEWSVEQYEKQCILDEIRKRAAEFIVDFHLKYK